MWTKNVLKIERAVPEEFGFNYIHATWNTIMRSRLMRASLYIGYYRFYFYCRLRFRKLGNVRNVKTRLRLIVN